MKIRVIDNGLFVSFARMLARQSKTVVDYYSPWQSSFPRSQTLKIGEGFDDLRRVNFPLEDADSVDLWVFLDLYHSDLQLFLESKGARVWGARGGEELELYRWDFKQYLKKLGLPVQPMEKVLGISALRDKLRKVEKKFVKTSFVRGDFETFKHETYELTEPRLDELEHVLGAAKHGYEFIIEDEIPDAVEVGYDGFTVDGKFPSHAMMAYEVKDCGMIGVVLSEGKLSEPVKLINSTLAPALKGYRYRGFWSTEIRYTKDKRAYFIDPCCRLGTPSNELLQELFDGWPQVLWDGAEGKLKSPTPVAKFGCMAIVHSEWAVNDWMAIHYPRKLDRFVKLRFHTRMQGKDYVPPQVVGLPDLGTVVGTGDTLLAAIKQCKERAAQIKGYQLKVDLSSIDSAMETIAQGEKIGIHFADNLPTAEAVRKV